MLSDKNSINRKFLEQNDSILSQTLLFGNPASSAETNALILDTTNPLVLCTNRFKEAL